VKLLAFAADHQCPLLLIDIACLWGAQQQTCYMLLQQMDRHDTITQILLHTI